MCIKQPRQRRRQDRHTVKNSNFACFAHAAFYIDVHLFFLAAAAVLAT